MFVCLGRGVKGCLENFCKFIIFATGGFPCFLCLLEIVEQCEFEVPDYWSGLMIHMWPKSILKDKYYESIILKTEPKSKEMVGRRERRRASRAGITNSHFVTKKMLSAYLMINSLILSAHIFDSLLLYQSKYIL